MQRNQRYVHMFAPETRFLLCNVTASFRMYAGVPILLLFSLLPVDKLGQLFQVIVTQSMVNRD